MKKKYIIEIDDDRNIIRNCGKTMLAVSIVIGKTAGSINTGIELTPYTEPDLEKVRKEAFDDGYKEGMQLSIDDAKLKEEYQRGLADSWEAAQKIGCGTAQGGFSPEMMQNIFGTSCFSSNVFHGLTASEAIEKIRQYEQEKEFKVGNEFENESGKKFVVLKMNGKEIDRYMDDDGNTYHMNVKYKVMRKTGRTFPEVAIVLEKMREGQK